MSDYAAYTEFFGTLVDAGFDVGLKTYPIWNEEYREILNNKIIDTYYNREIAFRVPCVFARKLKSKMQNIMPYYNMVYETLQEKYPILVDHDETVDITGESKNTRTGTNSTSYENGKVVTNSTQNISGKNTGRELTENSEGTNTDTVTKSGTVKNTGTNTTTYKDNGTNISDGSSLTNKSDYPTAGIAEVDSNITAQDSTKNKNNITDTREGNNNSTLSNSTTNTEENKDIRTDTNIHKVHDSMDEAETFNSDFVSTASGTDKQTGTQSNTENGTNTNKQHMTGYHTYPALLIKEYREAWENIDLQIINELNDLFLGIYSDYGSF